MNVDIAKIDSAVKAAIAKFSTANDKTKNQQKINRKSDAPQSTMSVARKAMIKFITPFVQRELQRRTLADVKRVVRVVDSYKGDKDAMARSCLSSAASASASAPLKKAFEKLNHYGYGDVFAIDKERVVKLVKIDHRDDTQEKLDKFMFEVDMSRAAAKLKVSPKIIDAFPCFMDANGELIGLIVMQRINGDTLRTWLSKTPSPVKQRVVSAKLEAAIQKLHDADIFHHSLMEDNVMVSSNGEPFIIDFAYANREPLKTSWAVNRGDRHRDFNILYDFEVDESRSRWRQSRNEQKSMISTICDMLIADNVLQCL